VKVRKIQELIITFDSSEELIKHSSDDELIMKRVQLVNILSILEKKGNISNKTLYIKAVIR